MPVPLAWTRTKRSDDLLSSDLTIAVHLIWNQQRCPDGSRIFQVAKDVASVYDFPWSMYMYLRMCTLLRHCTASERLGVRMISQGDYSSIRKCGITPEAACRNFDLRARVHLYLRHLVRNPFNQPMGSAASCASCAENDDPTLLSEEGKNCSKKYSMCSITKASTTTGKRCAAVW